MDCSIPDLITWEEPQVMTWDGLWCDSAINRYRLEPGSYGCSNKTCQNKFPANVLDGIWVPPNQYVWAYADQNFRPQPWMGDVQNESDVKKQTWAENDYANVKQLCPAGQVVTKITNAAYKSANKTNNVIDNNLIRGVIGRDTVGFGGIQNPNPFGGPMDFNALFGDPDYGSAKQLELSYKCGKSNVIIPDQPPQGVYGPGFYEEFNRQGQYDSLIKDPYYVNGVSSADKKINRNDTDVMIVRRSKPWRDHLKDCCFGTVSDPKLCGKIGPDDQRCSAFLTDCSADDIKTGGKCYSLCNKNPVECDAIKVKFCQEHPNDPFCDCINSKDRPAYKALVDKNQGTEIPAVCHYGPCSTGIDLTNVFLTKSIKDQRATTKCSDLVYQINQVTGQGNILTSNQGVYKDGEKNDVGPPETNSNSMIWYILIAFVVFIGMVIFALRPAAPPVYYVPAPFQV